MEAEKIREKREKEKKTVSFMIGIYCHKKHKTEKGKLCEDCRALTDYACARVEKCPHMENKTFCSSCKTPCYKPDMREKIRAVMRFSGPRMIFYCPGRFIRHKREERENAKKGA